MGDRADLKGAFPLMRWAPHWHAEPIVLALLLFLVGCATEYHQPFDAKSQLPDHTNLIVAGQTDQEAVRKLLGAPLLTSQHWQFDLFRQASAQVEIPIAITPWPIPFARLKDDLYRYTLVTYRDDFIVSAFDSGLFRSHADWRPPLENDYPSLSLTSGKYSFLIESGNNFSIPGHQNDGVLLLSSEGKEAFLKKSLDASACTLFISCRDKVCADTLRLDNGPAKFMTWPAAITALSLPPGNHILKVSDRRFSAKAALNFDCMEGSTSYVTVDSAAKPVKNSAGELTHAFLFGLTLGTVKLDPFDWVVKLHPSPPDDFAEHPLILWRNGTWLVNPEAGMLSTDKMTLDVEAQW